MMDLYHLSKRELYQIAMSDLPLEHRYEAAREMQSRMIQTDDYIEILRLLPFKPVREIADYLGIRYEDLRLFIYSKGLHKKVINNEHNRAV